MAVIPHAKNNYRPHLARSYGLVAMFFIVIGLQFGYNAATTGNVLGRESSVTISSLLDSTNKARSQASEPALVLNDKLNQAAYLKAQNMFAKQYWAHNAPDGTQPWKWFGSVGYDYDEAGENLAKNFTSTDAVMTAWLNSPEHRANILRNGYQDVGFAIMDGDLNGKPVSIIVALYGRPAESAVAGVSTTSFTEATVSGQINPLTQFAVAIQSINIVTYIGLAMIGMAFIAAAFAHKYRHKLPKSLRKTWYRHHGLYKSIGLAAFGVLFVFLCGGGQI